MTCLQSPQPTLFTSRKINLFIDGNKRAAMSAALTFLELNGADVGKFDGLQLYDAMIAIAEKRLDKSGLAEVFRSNLRG